MGNLIFTIIYGGSIIIYGIVMEVFLKKEKRLAEKINEKKVSGDV